MGRFSTEDVRADVKLQGACFAINYTQLHIEKIETDRASGSGRDANQPYNRGQSGRSVEIAFQAGLQASGTLDLWRAIWKREPGNSQADLLSILAIVQARERGGRSDT